MASSSYCRSLPGKDNLVRVALVKTANGVYTRPVNKLVVVLPSDEQSLVEHFPLISVVYVY